MTRRYGSSMRCRLRSRAASLRREGRHARAEDVEAVVRDLPTRLNNRNLPPHFPRGAACSCNVSHPFAAAHPSARKLSESARAASSRCLASRRATNGSAQGGNSRTACPSLARLGHDQQSQAGCSGYFAVAWRRALILLAAVLVGGSRKSNFEANLLIKVNMATTGGSTLAPAKS